MRRKGREVVKISRTTEQPIHRSQSSCRAFLSTNRSNRLLLLLRLLILLHIVVRRRSHRPRGRTSRRRILAPLPQPMPIRHKHEWDRRHRERDETKEGRRPAGVQPLVHLRREQRKRGADERAHDGRRRERAGGDEEVRVHDVREEAIEEEDDREAHRHERGERRPEGHARERRPAEPEEADREDRRGPCADLEPHLGRDGRRRVARDGSVVARVEDEQVGEDAEQAADEDREEHEPGDAGVEAVTDCEDNGESFEEQIDDAVDKLRGRMLMGDATGGTKSDVRSCRV